MYVPVPTYNIFCSCFFIADDSAPVFSAADPFYATQMAKNIKMNVFKNGTWGSYRAVPLEHVNDKPSSHAFLDFTVHGNPSSLRWMEGPLDPIT